MKKTAASILAIAFLLVGVLLLTAAFRVATSPGQFASPSPTFTAQPTQTLETPGTRMMPAITDRLAAPPTVYPPTQADLGAQVYYQVCMACHGDHGQGLTDEWRQVLDMPDQNCWQSGCHNPHHPPGGFVFPRLVPAVVGGGVLEQFQTAANLHTFIQSKMPFQAPGSLKEDEYWQLTAFLIRANGYPLPSTPLDEQVAQRLYLVAQPVVPAPKPSVLPIAGGLLVGILLILVAVIIFRVRKRSS